MRWAAVILAGGSGERLGGAVKALIELDGKRLIDRVADRLPGAATILVSCGRHDPRAWQLAPGWIALPDLPLAVGGPLAGLLAATAWAATQTEAPEALVLAPVDSPLLPIDLADRLLAQLNSAPASLARHEGALYPTSSAWRLDAIAGLPAQIAAGTAPRSLRQLAAQLAAVPVDLPLAEDGGNPLADLDTPADRAALLRRLGGN